MRPSDHAEHRSEALAQPSSALESRRPLGNTGVQVCGVGLGTMQFGWTVTDVDAMRILDAYWRAGGNLVDTANMYGGDQTIQSFASNAAHVGVSEDIIGRWIQRRQCRDDLILTTKVRARMWPGPDGEGLNRRHITKAVEDSLRRLRTDYVDVLYAHWPDPDAEMQEWLEAFGDLIRVGKVRHAGTSNFCGFEQFGDLLSPALELADDNAALARIEVEQPRYNLLNRAEYEDSGLQRIARRWGLGIITYSSLASGFLAGRFGSGTPSISSRTAFAQQYFTPQGWMLLDLLYALAAARGAAPAAIALAWSLAQPGITAAIVGPDSIDELAAASHAPGIHLTPEELSMLDELSWRVSGSEFVSW